MKRYIMNTKEILRTIERINNTGPPPAGHYLLANKYGLTDVELVPLVEAGLLYVWEPDDWENGLIHYRLTNAGKGLIE